MTDKRWEEIEKDYWSKVGELLDDTGYFDHDFVLSFFKSKFSQLEEEKKDIFCELRGLLKENAQFPDRWDTDERLKEWLEKRGKK